MLDKHIIPKIKKPLHEAAKKLNHFNITPNQVTCFGFLLGLIAFLLISFQYFKLGLIFILLNRLADGLDGALARIQGQSDAGGFLDISLDFIFYALIPLAFILAMPDKNAITGAILLVSFVGTGSSFLAFASIAHKYQLENPDYTHKSLYYMAGFAEGAETIIFFILICLFPTYFPILAASFALICVLTTANRIYSGFLTLKKNEAQTRQKERK